MRSHIESLAAASILFASIAANATLTELTGVIQLDAGGKHACAVTSGGGAKCWGLNFKGQLGDGTNSHRSAANDVAGLTSGVASVAASRGWVTDSGEGLGHSCAVTVSGGVKCWGANDYGQLGDGTTTSRLTPVDVTGLSAPATAVATGWIHTCALLQGGAVQCWGRNQAGELGDGTTTQRTTPVGVSGLASGTAEIAAGPAFTCALTSGGAIKCWGANNKGQLGDGTTTDRLAPVDVVGLGIGVVRVTVGGILPSSGPTSGHSCAITTSGGVKCWGSNNVGQLGEGSVTDRLTPFDVQGLTSGAVGVSAGGTRSYFYSGAVGHSCAVTSGGEVRCWGSDSCGKLGDGGGPGGDPFCDSSGYSSVPVSVTVPSAPASAVSAGGNITCAIASAGRVTCWGEGYGSSPTPVLSGTLPQAIAFGPKPSPSIPVGGSGNVSATGGPSGNPVTFTSLTPGICSVAGTTVSGFAIGRCSIAANQAGNTYYDPAPQVTQQFPIGAPASQAITFGPAPTVNVNGVGPLQATASSGLPVSFVSNTPSICSVSGGFVIGVSAGSCTVTATQAGDDLYGPAPQVPQTFPVGASDGTVGLGVEKAGLGTGMVVSSPAAISCGATCNANLAANTVLTLTATPDNGFYFVGWSGACTGTGNCVVTISAPRVVTATFGLNISIPRLVNISSRSSVLTGDNVMIAGFIIGGSVPKTVVVRARGPSLVPLGVANAMANPVLNLYSGQTNIGSNDDWQDAANAAALTASGFAPSNDLESAILVTLDPGPYTAIVSGAGGTTGTGIVEVFEVDHPELPLINIATRAFVGTGNDLLIGGFVIQGESPLTVVVRARGPSLASQGVSNPLPNPMLQLFRSSNGAQVRVNDDWNAWNDQDLAASGFAPSNPYESAILITLNPGAYTALVSASTAYGASSTNTGIAIIEVFKASCPPASTNCAYAF
jgi:alpha-tubulin suppressor-like RCC1 family protein